MIVNVELWAFALTFTRLQGGQGAVARYDAGP